MKYTLALDVYGTLIDTTGVFDTLSTYITDQPEAFMHAWRNKQLEYSFRRTAMKQYVPFSQCTKDALLFTAHQRKLSLSPTQVQELLQAYQQLPPFPDVAPGLQALKAAGHHLFAFSNGSRAALLPLLEQAQLLSLLDGVISVEATKRFKPSPEVYAYFNEQTQSKAEETYLVSSNTFDVIGAMGYGMRGVWVRRRDSVFDVWDLKTDLTSNDLIELTGKIES